MMVNKRSVCITAVILISIFAIIIGFEYRHVSNLNNNMSNIIMSNIKDVQREDIGRKASALNVVYKSVYKAVPLLKDGDKKALRYIVRAVSFMPSTYMYSSTLINMNASQFNLDQNVLLPDKFKEALSIAADGLGEFDALLYSYEIKLDNGQQLSNQDIKVLEECNNQVKILENIYIALSKDDKLEEMNERSVVNKISSVGVSLKKILSDDVTNIVPQQ